MRACRISVQSERFKEGCWYSLLDTHIWVETKRYYNFVVVLYSIYFQTTCAVWLKF